MYPIIWYLGFGVIVIVVQVVGKYMIIRYLDPKPYITLNIPKYPIYRDRIIRYLDP